MLSYRNSNFAVTGGSSDERSVHVMIRNPISGNGLQHRLRPPEMNAKLYVGNISFNTTEAALRTAFEPFGTVTDLHIANDRETGRPRGFAFITFETEEASKTAIEKMNGADFDGRPLTVNEARPKGESTSASGRVYSSPDRRAGAFHARGKRGR